jgi:hypothetical protein
MFGLVDQAVILTISRTRNSPAATPFAEGVYVITSTSTASHLAYQVSKPSSLGTVQKELGLHSKGSFILSAKNPKIQGRGAVSISEPAVYPARLQKQFQGKSWMPLTPEMLDYEGTQFLIMGEGLGDFGGAVKVMKEDENHDEKKKPSEELEDLGEEVLNSQSYCFHS